MVRPCLNISKQGLIFKVHRKMSDQLGDMAATLPNDRKSSKLVAYLGHTIGHIVKAV
jgi:hypothetical protein